MSSGPSGPVTLHFVEETTKQASERAHIAAARYQPQLFTLWRCFGQNAIWAENEDTYSMCSNSSFSPVWVLKRDTVSCLFNKVWPLFCEPVGPKMFIKRAKSDHSHSATPTRSVTVVISLKHSYSYSNSTVSSAWVLCDQECWSLWPENLKDLYNLWKNNSFQL